MNNRTWKKLEYNATEVHVPIKEKVKKTMMKFEEK
jgi:hypothetical protein